MLAKQAAKTRKKTDVRSSNSISQVGTLERSERDGRDQGGSAVFSAQRHQGRRAISGPQKRNQQHNTPSFPEVLSGGTSNNGVSYFQAGFQSQPIASIPYQRPPPPPMPKPSVYSNEQDMQFSHTASYLPYIAPQSEFRLYSQPPVQQQQQVQNSYGELIMIQQHQHRTIEERTEPHYSSEPGDHRFSRMNNSNCKTGISGQDFASQHSYEYPSYNVPATQQKSHGYFDHQANHAVGVSSHWVQQAPTYPQSQLQHLPTFQHQNQTLSTSNFPQYQYKPIDFKFENI
jgi:hypothetical protein